MYIECPKEPDFILNPSIFLAGGITGCPNWQMIAKEQLEKFPCTILNPRRQNFDINDKNIAEQQIKWEFKWLNRADIILFWFPKEEICPIALYELGRWTTSLKPLVIGAHEDYKRRFDVLMQTALARPDILIQTSLDNVIIEVVKLIYQP